MASGIFSFVKNQLVPRVKFGAAAAQETINTALLLALTSLNGNASLVSSLTTGGSKSLNTAAIATEVGLGKSLGKIMGNLINAINPNATRLGKEDLEQRKHFESSPGFFPAKQIPLYLHSFAKKQQQLINFLNHSSWLINRQITVRIVAPISSVIAILGGCGTLIVGALNMIGTIITFGSYPALNTRICHSLKSIGWMNNQTRQAVLGLYRPALLSPPKPVAIEEVVAEFED